MKQINIKYDVETNSGQAKRIKGKTDYYVGVSKICPICGNTIIGYPALSRKDNKTEICSSCGNIEAIQEFIKYQKVKDYKKEWKEADKIADKIHREYKTNYKTLENICKENNMQVDDFLYTMGYHNCNEYLQDLEGN